MNQLFLMTFVTKYRNVTEIEPVIMKWDDEAVVKKFANDYMEKRMKENPERQKYVVVHQFDLSRFRAFLDSVDEYVFQTDDSNTDIGESFNKWIN